MAGVNYAEREIVSIDFPFISFLSFPLFVGYTRKKSELRTESVGECPRSV